MSAAPPGIRLEPGPMQSSSEVLEDTGERMMPESSHPGSFWEHIYRYRFAAGFVRNKRVLDIACGEGYGSAALTRAGAASVTGVDISPEACGHARDKYGVDARPGSAERIPLPDRSVDVIVSFETIEHIQCPAAFLDECCRVLTRHGTLIISTPNKRVFSEAGIYIPFHCSEMYEQEFVALLTPRFTKWQMYTQSLQSAAFYSARSFTAEHSLWFRIKGPGRLRELLKARLCPHIRGSVKQSFRQAPVATILEKDKPLSRLVNPYILRERSEWSREIPAYFVAVAVQPR